MVCGKIRDMLKAGRGLHLALFSLSLLAFVSLGHEVLGGGLDLMLV